MSATMPTDTLAPDRTLVGVAWMLVTGVLFVGVTGIVRHLGSDMPAVEGAFIRYAFGTLLMVPALRPLLRRPPGRRQTGLYAARGFVHGFAVMLWFYAMARIPIAEVTAIGYTAPIFLIGLSLIGTAWVTAAVFLVPMTCEVPA